MPPGCHLCSGPGYNKAMPSLWRSSDFTMNSASPILVSYSCLLGPIAGWKAVSVAWHFGECRRGCATENQRPKSMMSMTSIALKGLQEDIVYLGARCQQAHLSWVGMLETCLHSSCSPRCLRDIGGPACA